jgi:hypothetical protein
LLALISAPWLEHPPILAPGPNPRPQHNPTPAHPYPHPPPQEFIDYAAYVLSLSYSSYDLTQHLDGQPMQFMIKDAASNRHLLNLAAWHANMSRAMGCRGPRRCGRRAVGGRGLGARRAGMGVRGAGVWGKEGRGGVRKG